MPEKNLLLFGDNLRMLRECVKDETADLIYLDPPFNSNKAYNVILREKNGSDSTAQIRAFEDTWSWGPAAQDAYEGIIQRSDDAAEAMSAFFTLLDKNNLMAYLAMMAPRLVELRRVLKPTGSIYLH